jgi:chromosome segregation protein
MHMAETCLNELGIERPELVGDGTLELVSGEELNARDQAYREMRAKLDGMGPVNMMALEEYRETTERHGFLDGQRKDLISSIENTTSTIREIDEISRQKFTEAFEKINENFQTTFKKLFGGGHAFMKLTDEENSAESGIDVVASPPGKRLQSVLLLSGGEKALTALSLLVGIFQYTPSPFCILDEVDAPLDEANIGRFTEHCAGAVWGDDAGTGGFEAGVGAVWGARKSAGACKLKPTSMLRGQLSPSPATLSARLYPIVSTPV